MKYRIVHESAHRFRIRLYSGPVTAGQEEIIQYAFSAIKGVDSVTVYRATASVAFTYTGDRSLILKKLDAFNFENVTLLAKEAPSLISVEEVRSRKLDPALKGRLRMRVLLATIADLALPVPIQLGYHAWQMITLKDI